MGNIEKLSVGHSLLVDLTKAIYTFVRFGVYEWYDNMRP